MKKAKGSLTIEASFVLPIFLLAIFSIIYLIKVIYIHEQVQHAISEAAREMSVGAYILETADIIDLQQGVYKKAKNNIQPVEASYFELNKILDGLIDLNVNQEDDFNIDIPDWRDYSSLSDEIENKIRLFYKRLDGILGGMVAIVEDSSEIILSAGAVKGLELVNNAIGSKIARNLVKKHIRDGDYSSWGIIGGEKGMDYSKSEFLLKDDDIYIVVSYHIEMPFLKEILQPFSINQAVKTRAYTGNGNLKRLYKEKERDQKEIIYVTKNGTKYHTNRKCRYIDIKLIPSHYGQVKASKTICEVCGKKNIPLYDLTAIYSTETSPIFHISDQCWTIKRDVIEISLEEALEKGYTYCSKCKGEEEK